MTSFSDRESGAGLAGVIFLLGVLAGVYTSLFQHEPNLARFIFAGIWALGVVVMTLPAIVVDYEEGESVGFGIGMALIVMSLALYTLLSGLSVPFWTRFAASCGMLVVGVAAMVVSYRLEVRRKRKRIERRAARRG